PNQPRRECPMANEKRVRTNFIGGNVDVTLASGGTTLSSAALASAPVVDTTNHMAIILDPQGTGGTPEIAYITAHSSAATTATILRGQEGSSARSVTSGLKWAHGPTVRDYRRRPYQAQGSGSSDYAVANNSTTLVDT